MKVRILSIKTLLRSPIKTLLSFLLLAASTFLLIYNVADYAITTREFRSVMARYYGTLNVEQSYLDADASRPLFLLSDLANGADALPYETYHQQPLTEAELDTLASLPYVSAVSRRYLTAGLSDQRRTDEQGMHDTYAADVFFPYTARLVFEATVESVGQSTNRMASLFDARDVLLSDWKVLAGNGCNLDVRDLGAPEGQLRITMLMEAGENWYFMNNHYRKFVYYCRNVCTEDMLENLQPGHRYVIVARSDPNEYGSEDTSDGMDFVSTYIGDDTLYDWWPYFYDITDLPENYLELPTFADLRELIQVTNDDLHTFDVVYTDDMSAIRRVAEDKLLCTQGRFLTPEDAAENRPVCVVSETLLNSSGLSVGDTLSLKLGDKLFENYAPLGAVASLRGRYADNWTEEIEFTIVGAFVERSLNKLRSTELNWAYSDNAVFVPLTFLPESAAAEDFPLRPEEVSFTIGNAQEIEAFVEECLPLLKDMGYSVYFSDHGWLRMEQQLNRSSFLTLCKLLVFALASALSLGLTVYLFIGRKQKDFAIMRALGTPKGKARRCLFLPLMLLSVLGIAVGGVTAAYYAAGRMAETLQDFTDLGLTVDTALPLTALGIALAAELAFLVLSAGLALAVISRRPPLELLQANPAKRHKKRKSTAPEPVSTLTFAPLPPIQPLPGGQYSAVRHVAKYIARHSRRNLARSLLSLLLAALLFGAMGQFMVLRQSYREAYQTVEVHPKIINGLSVVRAGKIAESDYVRDPYYETVHVSGQVELKHASYCFSSYLPRVEDREIRFADGYDKESFAQVKEPVLVITEGFLASLGLQMGDTVNLGETMTLTSIMEHYPEETQEQQVARYYKTCAHFTIVGIVPGENAAMVYVPMAARKHISAVADYLPLDLAEYTLNDYHQADEFLAYAKQAVDDPNHPTSPICIVDTSEADNIYLIYRLIETLFPIAAVAALIICGILPALIILQSAKEAAILRILGTSKARTRSMLVFEQLLLCLAGLVLAFAMFALGNGSALAFVLVPLGIYCALYFAACTIGTLIAAVSVTKQKVLELLQTKE